MSLSSVVRIASIVVAVGFWASLLPAQTIVSVGDRGADVTTKLAVCEADGLAIALDPLLCPCPSGVAEFKVELGGLPLCGWGSTSVCRVEPYTLPIGSQNLVSSARCFASACSVSLVQQLEVIEDRPPEPVGNVLRLTQDIGDVWIAWSTPPGPDVYDYRAYKSRDPSVPNANRLPTSFPFLDLGAVNDLTPITFYQLVGLSCGGGAESPY